MRPCTQARPDAVLPSAPSSTPSSTPSPCVCAVSSEPRALRCRSSPILASRLDVSSTARLVSTCPALRRLEKFARDSGLLPCSVATDAADPAKMSGTTWGVSGEDGSRTGDSGGLMAREVRGSMGHIPSLSQPARRILIWQRKGSARIRCGKRHEGPRTQGRKDAKTRDAEGTIRYHGYEGSGNGTM